MSESESKPKKKSKKFSKSKSDSIDDTTIEKSNYNKYSSESDNNNGKIRLNNSKIRILDDKIIKPGRKTDLLEGRKISKGQKEIDSDSDELINKVNEDSENKSDEDLDSTVYSEKNHTITKDKNHHDISDSDSESSQETKKVIPKKQTKWPTMEDFLSENPSIEEVELRKFKKALKLSPDEEIYLLQIPPSIDPEELINCPISLNKKSKIKLEQGKYIVTPEEETTPLLILSNEFKRIQPLKTLKLEKYIRVEEQPEIEATVPTKQELPSNIKVRHPLFGADYEAKIELEKEIQERLEQALKRFENKVKKPRKKAEDKNQLIFKILEERCSNITNSSIKDNTKQKNELLTIEEEPTIEKDKSHKRKHESNLESNDTKNESKKKKKKRDRRDSIPNSDNVFNCSTMDNAEEKNEFSIIEEESPKKKDKSHKKKHKSIESEEIKKRDEKRASILSSTVINNLHDRPKFGADLSTIFNDTPMKKKKKSKETEEIVEAPIKPKKKKKKHSEDS